MSNMPNDLVQIDLDTAMALYLAGYSNIPIIVDNGYPGGWASMEPRHFEDLFDGVMFFASDSKRESLLNPPKTDVDRIKEEIYLETEKAPEIAVESLTASFTDDEDDDPDWIETEPCTEPEAEPETADEIPDEDASVPTVSKVAEEGDSTDDIAKEKTYILMEITAIEDKIKKPWTWNVRDCIRYHEKLGISTTKLAKLYGIKSPQTVINRINNFKCK